MVRCVVSTRRAFLFLFCLRLFPVPPIDRILEVRRSSFAARRISTWTKAAEKGAKGAMENGLFARSNVRHMPCVFREKAASSGGRRHGNG